MDVFEFIDMYMFMTKKQVLLKGQEEVEIAADQ